MSRAEGVTIHKLEHLARRTIIGNRVWRRSQAVEVVPTIGIRLELAAQVELNLLGILLLVQAVCRRLPHLNRRANKRLLSLKVHDTAVHKDHLAILGLGHDDIRTVVAVGRVSAEEGTQDSGCSGRILGFLGELEGDFVHEADLD